MLVLYLSFINVYNLRFDINRWVAPRERFNERVQGAERLVPLYHVHAGYYERYYFVHYRLKHSIKRLLLSHNMVIIKIFCLSPTGDLTICKVLDTSF